MNQPRKLKGLFAILLGIGILLLIPLFFAIRSPALQTPPAAHKQAWVAGTVALCIAVFGGIWALNAWGARRLQRKIDELGG